MSNDTLNELTERVARAIRKQSEYPVAHLHTEEEFQKQKPYWMDVAEAAIVAMRESSSVSGRAQREEQSRRSGVTVEAGGSNPSSSTNPSEILVDKSLPYMPEDLRESFEQYYEGVQAEFDRRSAQWGFECGAMHGECQTVRESSKRLLDEFLEQPMVAEQWEEFKLNNSQFGAGA